MTHAPDETKVWPPNCDACGKPLERFSALYFSPPDPAGWVVKMHWCVGCAAKACEAVKPRAVIHRLRCPPPLKGQFFDPMRQDPVVCARCGYGKGLHR